jgi:hypothetical protein
MHFLQTLTAELVPHGQRQWFIEGLPITAKVATVKATQFSMSAHAKVVA